MKIVRTASFEKSLKKLGATEADIVKLMATILANPDIGDVVPGLSGARKIRFAMKGCGKRGGGRAIYVVMWSDDVAILLFAYSKSVQDDLSEHQRSALRTLIEEYANG